LAPCRAASFADWYAVGGALHSVAPTDDMFHVWDTFSQLCPAKYSAKECETRWKTFNDTVTIGTLIRLAREDDSHETARILQDSPSVLIGRVAEGSHESSVLTAPRHLPCTALPVSADVYAPSLAASHHSQAAWALTPRPVFTCAEHVFLAVFTITDGGQRTHRDGALRVLGITAESKVVLGVKRAPFTKSYLWFSVAHIFRDSLRTWFEREHAATVAMLPPPEEHPPRPPLWRLPCCLSVKPCRLKSCEMVTPDPWLRLRELQAHGLVARTEGGDDKV